MSSVFAFVRAGVMLGCLVAAPVLAITHGGAMECARKAVVRLWDRGPRELDPGHENESVAREQLPGRMQAGANRVARAERPSADGLPPHGPEPVEHRQVRSIPSSVEPTDLPPADPSHPRPAAYSSPGFPEEPTVTDWQSKASSLQQLGAIEYALEKWGDSGRLYRFRCVLAVAGSHTNRRHFEAVSEDGARAVDDVVEQVRAWQASSSRAN